MLSGTTDNGPPLRNSSDEKSPLVFQRAFFVYLLRSFRKVFARAICRLVVLEIPLGGCAMYAPTVIRAAFAFRVNAPGCLIAP